jgi:hypothetical protein
MPDTVISDRGPQFASSFMQELSALLGIKLKMSTAYHPQMDGQTERMNQELEQYLRLFVNQRQSNWVQWLAIAEFSYNNKIQSSTQTTPFFANTGQHPRMGFEPRRETKVEVASDFAERMRKVHEELNAALLKAQEEMQRYADRERREAPQYKKGDKVMLSMENLATDRPSRKLAERQIGPYEIQEVLNPNAVLLKLPSNIRISPHVNVSHIRPYTAPSIPGQRESPQSPIVIDQDGTPRYELEEILDSRLKRGKLEYLVKWKNWTDESNTWEPSDNVDSADEALKEFHHQHPSAPRKVNQALFKSLIFRPYQNFTIPNRVPTSCLNVSEI